MSRSNPRPRASVWLVAVASLSACAGTDVVDVSPPELRADTLAQRVPIVADRESVAGGRDDEWVVVRVVGHPELSTPDGGARMRNGRVRVPLLGEVEVAGRPLEEVERDIERELSFYLRYPVVTIHPVVPPADRAMVPSQSAGSNSP